MKEELIQLPKIEEIKEIITIAKQDLKTEIEQDPDLKASSELILEVIKIVEGKLAQVKNFDSYNDSQKIDLAAHLNFLQTLLEDFFMFDAFDDEDMDDEELDDFEEEEDK